MRFAITLVTPPSDGALLLDAAAALQRDFGGSLEFRWLGEGEAVDLIYGMGTAPSQLAGEGRGDLAFIKKMTADAVAHRPIDWCVQPAGDRRKRMLVADMDSTMIGQESLDEIADLKGAKAEITALTERAMCGEYDFASSLRERMRLLGTVTEADLQRVLRERITLNSGARTLVQTMNANSAHTVLVSGGFTFFTRAIAAKVGFAVNRGNVFLWENGRISGVVEPILGREAKLETLEEQAAAQGIAPSDTIAVGDGANDLAMLKGAGLGVAYRAKKVVAAEADAQVRHADLTALLYFQGYERVAFRENAA